MLLSGFLEDKTLTTISSGVEPGNISYSRVTDFHAADQPQLQVPAIADSCKGLHLPACSLQWLAVTAKNPDLKQLLSAGCQAMLDASAAASPVADRQSVLS